MAFSSSEGKEFFRDWLNHVGKALQFKTFLDVGCGAGLYGKILREVFGEDATIDAIDIFPEYVSRHNLNAIYNEIFIEDIRLSYSRVNPYNLIVTGDVLEHLTKEDAIKVVDGLKTKCRFLWAALPVSIGRTWSTGYRQAPDEWVENPANEHLHEWTGDEIQESFRPLFLVPYVQTGTFLVEGDIR